MKKSIFAMLAGVAIGSFITLGIMVAVDVHTKEEYNVMTDTDQMELSYYRYHHDTLSKALEMGIGR